MIIETRAECFQLANEDTEVWALRFGDLYLVAHEENLRTKKLKSFAAPRGGFRYDQADEADVIARLRSAGCWELKDNGSGWTR